MLPVLHPDAAGIDIGAQEMFVAVHRIEMQILSGPSAHSLETCMSCATGFEAAQFASRSERE
jgi:hypothetical protein